MLRFTPANVATIPNRAGNYYFYSARGVLLYTGVSEILRHRLQSYYQKDDFSEHPTKRGWRSKIAYFSVVYRSIGKARKVEKKVKQNGKYNRQKKHR